LPRAGDGQRGHRQVRHRRRRALHLLPPRQGRRPDPQRPQGGRQRRPVAAGDELAALGAMTAALEAERLYRFFHAGDDETLALRGVSLSLDRGEMVAVTGPSETGKSTLLNVLAGLDEPDGGQVRVDGERLS